MAEAATTTEKNTTEKKHPIKSDRDKKHKVKVYRRDKLNENMPIVVCHNSSINKKEFMSGDEVELTQSEISILEDARIEHRIDIPDNSGIYEASNPMLEAQKQNPGFEAKVDIKTGTIYLQKSDPIYIVQRVNP